MKRVVKFRGKSLYDKYPKANGGFEIPQGAFVYGNLVVDMNGNPQIDIQGYIDGNSFHHSLWVDADTVGQFTGLLDRNGKEIYEGDICSLEYNHGFFYMSVEWNEESAHFGFRLKGENHVGCSDAFCDWIKTKRVSVIGNIYDNPELLKGGKYGNQEV